MAKLMLNSALHQLRGSLGAWVVRATRHGEVLSRRPDMSRVEWSPAQQAHRKKMKAAAVYYRKVMAEPALAARYVARARRRQIPVSSLVMGEFLKSAGAKVSPAK